MKITIDTFLKDKPVEEESYAITWVLKDIDIALPERDVYLREGQIRRLPLKPALILSRHDYVKIMTHKELLECIISFLSRYDFIRVICGNDEEGDKDLPG